jgi:hypothetical protein
MDLDIAHTRQPGSFCKLKNLLARGQLGGGEASTAQRRALGSATTAGARLDSGGRASARRRGEHGPGEVSPFDNREAAGLSYPLSFDPNELYPIHYGRGYESFEILGLVAVTPRRRLPPRRPRRRRGWPGGGAAS